jgi:uncharacterized membrane protein
MLYRDDQRLETAMGRMLQIGVTVAALVVLVGGALYLRQFTGPVPDYRRFHGAPAAYESVHGILLGVSHFDSGSVIALGILLLIATPACRVLFGVVGFSMLRDRFYAAVSLIVLVILVLSFCTRR